jgi:predicted RecA/RadA family phage recombinase
MAEAIRVQDPGQAFDFTPAAAAYSGEVVLLPSGLAGVIPSDTAAGIKGSAHTEGVFTLAKTASAILLDGAPVYWDHSAGTASYLPGNDKDFFVGTAVGDSVSTATTVNVNLNVQPRNIVDLRTSTFDSVAVLTAGLPFVRSIGGGAKAQFSATAEAQKLDLLSTRSFPVESNWIMEAMVKVVVNADADVADLNIGIANATHASDADSITEAMFLRLDMGADLNIDARSSDGTTTVANVDTTIDWAVGTAFHVIIDGRNTEDIQVYINNANVLPSSVFKLNAATGPLKALFHLEKSSNDSPGEVDVQLLTVRIADDQS